LPALPPRTGTQPGSPEDPVRSEREPPNAGASGGGVGPGAGARVWCRNARRGGQERKRSRRSRKARQVRRKTREGFIYCKQVVRKSYSY